MVTNPARIYLFKVNNGNSTRACKICLKITIKAPEQRQLLQSSIFIFNFEQISYIVLYFYCRLWNKEIQAGKASGQHASYKSEAWTCNMVF